MRDQTDRSYGSRGFGVLERVALHESVHLALPLILLNVRLIAWGDDACNAGISRLRR